ncbi:hypothetical protein M2139_001022 [Enterococcus sp. PF1-24]|uniref:hypothetical protein n=1 Tax=unclassified Enterococcus TaxID=2608891 RepID=UPI002475B866|nr:MULTISPECIES: hypothetical protein [unclassified Enterococcus]MDH6364037.1 hypothetical protein [Enterococcus sp. PFB1-1]MDH6401138.1 hypothetical protein [Enterococcus sp. PF1-24]
MLKKKGLGLLAVGATAILLTGCGKSAKDTAVEFLTEQGSYNTFNIRKDEITFEDLELELAEPDVQLQMAASQIKDAKITTTTTIDLENKLTTLDGELKILGATIPFEGFMEENTVYYSMDSLKDILDAGDSFIDVPLDELYYIADATAGQYFKVDHETLKEMSAANNDGLEKLYEDEKLFDFDYFDGSPILANEIFAEYTATLPEDSFTKEKDIVSRIYTEEELENFLEFLGEYDEGKLEEDLDINFRKEFRKIKKELDKLDFSFELVMDTKAKTATYYFDFFIEDDDDSVTGQLKVARTFSNEAVDLKLPAKKNMITTEDITEIQERYYQESLTKITDQELDEELKKWVGYLDAEDFLRIYFDYYFTDKQNKKIEDYFAKNPIAKMTSVRGYDPKDTSDESIAKMEINVDILIMFEKIFSEYYKEIELFGIEHDAVTGAELRELRTTYVETIADQRESLRGLENEEIVDKALVIESLTSIRDECDDYLETNRSYYEE